MFFAAVDASYSPGLQLGRGKAVLFDHHAGHIEFFCCRTAHQDSFDHSTNISHRRGIRPLYLAAPAREPRRRSISASLFAVNGSFALQLITFDKFQQPSVLVFLSPFPRQWFRVIHT